ncbi:hypothetical protein LUZ61_007703 [Rhynchospora tenuis]|uniref:VQ domain-containing protein n=1 Tax=Rhynchospora tenuis TaxID=198213 RepID=A0AAD5ZU31_9POAL|nr:hypothetical protein LUZ61_007703 [Rhynchospora tenuis]
MEPRTDKNPLTLPTSPNSSTSSSSSSTNNGSTTGSGTGSVPHPSTPKPNTAIPRTIETTPYPTTFVQADSASFKQVVQMLTGSTSCNTTSCKSPPISNRGPPTGPKKQSFKLYERRGSLKNLKSISPLVPTGPAFFSPRAQTDVLSPSILDFPSLVLSPVTPLSPSLASPAEVVNKMEEEKAIAEKGFYLHPSPRGAEPPRLLPLFPMTSPRVSSD